MQYLLRVRLQVCSCCGYVASSTYHPGVDSWGILCPRFRSTLFTHDKGDRVPSVLSFHIDTWPYTSSFRKCSIYRDFGTLGYEIQVETVDIKSSSTTLKYTRQLTW